MFACSGAPWFESTNFHKDRHLYGSNRLSASRKTCAIPSVYPALVQMGPTCRSFRKRVPSFTSSWRSLSDRQSPEIPSVTLPRSKLSARFSRHYGGNPAAYTEDQDPRMHCAGRKQSAGETHERSRTFSVSQASPTLPPSSKHSPLCLTTLASLDASHHCAGLVILFYSLAAHGCPENLRISCRTTVGEFRSNRVIRKAVSCCEQTK
jgi:hypothetical protein